MKIPAMSDDAVLALRSLASHEYQRDVWVAGVVSDRWEGFGLPSLDMAVDALYDETKVVVGPREEVDVADYSSEVASLRLLGDRLFPIWFVTEVSKADALADGRWPSVVEAARGALVAALTIKQAIIDGSSAGAADKRIPAVPAAVFDPSLIVSRKTVDGLRFSCPCCECLTLDEQPPGTHCVCCVCGWQDDDVQFRLLDFGGGANNPSLHEARAYYRAHGVSEARFTNVVKFRSMRLPRVDELPQANSSDLCRSQDEPERRTD